MNNARPSRPLEFGDLTPIVETRRDATVLLRARQPLAPYPVRLTDRLEHFATVAPERPLFSWRTPRGRDYLTYGDALSGVRSLAQALLDRSLGADRAVAILSGNDREHALLALAAQYVGIPYAPVSPAYSLLTADFATLRHILTMLSPGLVFAADDRFARAISAAGRADAEVIDAAGGQRLLSTAATRAVDDARDRINATTVAKILFTSGSTGVPKGVVNTHGMLCSNQQMNLQTFPFLANEPPVLVDWLPWHHTFGGNHNVGLVLYNGGTLHIDDGRPVAGAFDETARNLREHRPTIYLNVPKGFEELVRALTVDRELARRFFSSVRCLFSAAADLPEHIGERLHALSVEACGARVPLVTGLGSTETAPLALARPWHSAEAGAVGLPVPGVEAKLAPIDAERYELRVRGPNVTPGYWRRVDLTAAAFDEEQFHRTGDVVRWRDASDPERGLLFAGRLAEDFKMSTGTWVRVGALRARVVQHFAPYVRDAVITGHDSDAPAPEVIRCDDDGQ